MTLRAMISIDSKSPSAMYSSFRDPGGCVVLHEGRVLRVVNEAGRENLACYFSSPTANRYVENGKLIRSWLIDPAQLPEVELPQCHGDSDGHAVVEHAKVAFVSFPYEWSPSMLYEAGRLTLQLASDLLPEGVGLKDATPFNILFRATDPVFVDVLSFEFRERDNPIWNPYAQFVRTFVLPLLVNRHFHLRLDQIFATRRDGLEPEEVYELCGWIRKLLPPFLTQVSLPTSLNRWASRQSGWLYSCSSRMEPKKAAFVLSNSLQRLRRQLESAAPNGTGRSRWVKYYEIDHHYSDEAERIKRGFVENALCDFSPKRVLDVGCNTGAFSIMCARHNADVVAIDSDPAVIDDLWRQARAARLKILPLVINFSQPSPGIGWRNRECASFIGRAEGSFDTVLALAVIHHLMVSDGIPLRDVMELLARLTTNLLVVEFVAPADVMFRRLSRGRDGLFAHLSADNFERVCAQHFNILRSRQVQQTRTIYLLQKRR